MRRWMMMAVVMACFWGGVAQGYDVVPGVSANDQFIKGWVGLGDPNEGLIGPYAAWNDQDPGRMWGTGIRGQYDISGPMREGVTWLFGAPQSWWDVLDKVGARAYVFHEVGVANLMRGAEAVATPGIGARLFVLTVELGYDIFEGGKIKSDGGTLAESGMTYFIGVTRVFRF